MIRSSNWENLSSNFAMIAASPVSRQHTPTACTNNHRHYGFDVPPREKCVPPGEQDNDGLHYVDYNGAIDISILRTSVTHD